MDSLSNESSVNEPKSELQLQVAEVDRRALQVVDRRLVKQKQPTRITVVETVYFQSPTHKAVAHDSRFSKLVHSEEQVYGPRRYRATELWEQIDSGWFRGSDQGACGMLTIKNEETGRDKVLQVAVWVNRPSMVKEFMSFSIIPPGESIRIVPEVVDLLHIRNQIVDGGDVAYSLTLMPA